MCTVTYIPTPQGCIITSNRDEKIARERASVPKKYLINGSNIIFPKDSKAGGTWIAHTEDKIIVLLNGAQEQHISKPNYRKSRGLIVLDLIAAKNTLAYWEHIDLTTIEPFTIVLCETNRLMQLQWNELTKNTTEFDAKQSHIWSSSTLYSKEIRTQRQEWFRDFIKSKNYPTPKETLDFHEFTASDNKEFGLQINRNNLLKTVSITQCVVNQGEIKMEYIDLFE